MLHARHMATHTAMKRRRSGLSALAGGVTLLALALSLTGCANSPMSSADSAAEPAIGRMMESQSPDFKDAGEVGAAPMAADTAAGGPLPAATHALDQSIIKRGTARLVADNPEETFTTMASDVAALGGSVKDSSINPLDSGPFVWATLRIPAKKFDAFVATMSTYGTVEEISTSTEDVGAQIADLDARIQALEASIARLRDLMAKADTTADLLEAESQMTSRQAELDSMKAQRSWYGDQVEMSTLDVSITSPLSFKGESGSVWEQSWQGFVSGVTTIVVAIIWLLPWAILLAIILVPLLIWRGRRRRAKLAQKAQLEGNTSGGLNAQASCERSVQPGDFPPPTEETDASLPEAPRT